MNIQSFVRFNDLLRADSNYTRFPRKATLYLHLYAHYGQYFDNTAYHVNKKGSLLEQVYHQSSIVSILRAEVLNIYTADSPRCWETLT